MESFGVSKPSNSRSSHHSAEVPHSYRNMHFEPADFVSFTITILETTGFIKTINTTTPFGMGALRAGSGAGGRTVISPSYARKTHI